LPFSGRDRGNDAEFLLFRHHHDAICMTSEDLPERLPKWVSVDTTQLPPSGSERGNKLFRVRHLILDAERTIQ